MSDSVVIGVEVHVQLATREKLFCRCENRFGAPPNTLVCPVCRGWPGALPVLNPEALRLALRAASALDLEIASTTKWDRKSYFYPDLPKGYQITQYDRPVAGRGAVTIPGGQRVRIVRAHLEEDAAATRIADAGPIVDDNRAGVPLLEIVSEPDLRSAAEAVAYVRALREILVYAGVTDADLEKGQLRADPNVNRIVDGAPTPVVEWKNLNTLSGMERAIECEIRRQDGSGGRETRGWDEDAGRTVPLREKEEAFDYRYFPEPDLPEVTIDPKTVAAAAADLPEMPAARRARYVADLGLTEYDAGVLTAERAVADYFEAAAREAGEPHAKEVANRILGEALRDRGADGGFPVPPERLGALARLVGTGRLAREAATREVWPAMVASGHPPEEIAEERGLAGRLDVAALAALIDRAIADSPHAVRAVRAGKEAAVGPIVGKVLAAARGRADPAEVRARLLARIDRG